MTAAPVEPDDFDEEPRPRAGWNDDLEEDVLERPGFLDRLRDRFRRDEAEDDGPAGVVVPLTKQTAVPALPDPPKPTKVGAALEKAGRPFPTKAQLAHSARVVAVYRAPQAARVVARTPKYAAKELGPVWKGIARTGAAWANWRSDTAFQVDGVGAAEGNAKAKAAEAHKRTKAARTYISLALFVLFVAGAWVLYEWFTWWFVGVLIVLLAVFDLIGRAGKPKAEEKAMPAMPAVLGSDVPLKQITASILATFTREGFEEGSVRVARPLSWDASRQEYRVSLATADAIKPEHLRAIERAIGARDHSVRSLASDTAQVRNLVVRIGDPLRDVGPLPYVATGSRSYVDLQDLGATSGETSFELSFAGLHGAVVGKTGSGKTKGLLWAVIDRLSACRDVVLWGCDLQAGPAFPWWRGVIQRKAFSIEQAQEMLAAAQAEVDRRMAILTEIAESDDDLLDPDYASDADTDEWHSGLGPALVIMFDEFSIFAANDGSKGTVDLMTPLEQIIRTGRKVWVLLLLGTQKTGNSDFGSTVISSSLGFKIMMACEEADTIRMLSTRQRDEGWSPHLFATAQPGNVRDAGKCFVESPRHDTPDVYRTYAPMTVQEVRRRARQRLADGLPSLDGSGVRAGVIDAQVAVEVPDALVAVEAAFAGQGWPDRIPSKDLINLLRADGMDLPEPGDSDDDPAARALAALLRDIGLRPRQQRWRPTPGANAVRGYYAEDVRSVIEDLG